MTNINQGAGGFHLYTVVTDGYNNYIAEDSEGQEIARVAATGETSVDFVKDMTELSGRVARSQDTPPAHTVTP
jgi:hypothetical protein